MIEWQDTYEDDTLPSSCGTHTCTVGPVHASRHALADRQCSVMFSTGQLPGLHRNGCPNPCGTGERLLMKSRATQSVIRKVGPKRALHILHLSWRAGTPAKVFHTKCQRFGPLFLILMQRVDRHAQVVGEHVRSRRKGGVLLANLV